MKAFWNKWHNVLSFFVLPLFFLFSGTHAAAQTQRLKLWVLPLLYLFVLLNRFLHYFFTRHLMTGSPFSKKTLIILESFQAMILIFVGWRYSWLAAWVGLLYSFFIQVSFLFYYYELPGVAPLIETVLNVFFLNYFAYYLQLGFFPYGTALVQKVLPFACAYFLQALYRWQEDIETTGRLGPITATILPFVALAVSYSHLGLKSLWTLLLVIPAAACLRQRTTLPERTQFLAITTGILTTVLFYSF